MKADRARRAGVNLAAAFGAGALGGWAGQTPAPAPAAGPVVRLSHRALQPGEPILVVLESDGAVRSAAVTFLGGRVDLRPGPKKGTFLAFLGIDVQIKPGSYGLIVKVHKAGGLVENVRKDLLIVERKFPSTMSRIGAAGLAGHQAAIGQQHCVRRASRVGGGRCRCQQ